MADWKKHIERADQFSLKVNLSDLTSMEDLEKLLYAFFIFRTQPEISSQPLLEGVLTKASSILNSLKTSGNRQDLEEILSFLCSFMKIILNSLDRSEDPLRYIKSLEDKLVAISTGVKTSIVKTYFDLHGSDIPEFVVPAQELLDEAKKSLLLLQKSPEDNAKIDDIFRVFHTLKGEANLTGLSSIGTLAHEAEDFLVVLRTGTIKTDDEIIRVLLKVVEHLHKLLDVVSLNPQQAALEDVKGIIEELQTIRTEKANCVSLDSSSDFIPQPPQLDPTGGLDYLTDFAAEAFDHLANAEKSILILETNPNDNEAINNIFRVFHTIKGA
ncbi:MAG: Hpt domain-containing protein, partial [Candidatus Omnitrophota bacterium]